MRRIDLRREEGVAMTEFALIVPVFLLIVIGLLAFGRIFFYWIETNHLASETARWAVVDRNPYAPSKTLQQQARDSGTTEFQSDVKVCIDFPGKTLSTAELGDPVRVRVQKPFRLTLKMPGFSPVDTGITIRGTSTMRIERLANNNDPSSYSDTQNVGTCS